MAYRSVPTFLLLGTVLFLAPGAMARDVIHPYLAERMAAAQAGQQIDAYVVMRDQLDLEYFAAHTGRMGPRERRRFVADTLKAHAAQTQATVRGLLDARASQGRARLIEVLWMGNAILFSADPAVIEELAQLDGIDRLRAIVDQGPEVYLDVEPPAPAFFADTPAADAPTASYPFADDFESGGLGTAWITAATGKGFVRVMSAHGPIGNYHVVMASSVDSVQSTASITVALDLVGQTNVGIRFQHKEFNDEANFLDGVFVSEDGITYQKALDLSGGSSTYTTRVVDLDPTIAALGLTYTSNFHIRFSWDDNFTLETDGFAFDDIEIAPGVGEPPPATIEQNIVQLQAPLLWDMGFTGQGALIGNIDSGVTWTHPDLINRIWTNPGEIDGNGIDDDGNGKIDDMHGWDFASNNNDPSSGATHGTNTAGIVLGDGASGQITGMAIGGTMVACEISGEANYWQAQQYCLDVGVDAITSSHSYKWPFSPKPDYHMHRQMCTMELAAGIIHSNSIGNQGNSTGSYPIPFNISAPGNCPTPWGHPSSPYEGRSSVMGCAGIHVPDDSLYTSSGQGPSAWEDITIYNPSYPHTQDPNYWDYPYGGFGGGLPGLIKPDMCAYTDSVMTTTNSGGYSSFGGTSAATPHLGGALMLLASMQPEALPRHICGALELTGTDLGAAGKDLRYGSGKIQVWDAARRLVMLARLDNPMPSLGSPINFDLFGQPNATTFGFVAGLVNAAGTGLNLRPPVFLLGAWSLDINGQGLASFTIPNAPALVGVVAHFQFGHLPMNSDWGPDPLISVTEFMVVAP